MTKVYRTIEATYFNAVFQRFAKQAQGTPMLSLMLSSVGDLINIVDVSPSAQAKVREILDSIAAEWPVVSAPAETIEGTDNE